MATQMCHDGAMQNTNHPNDETLQRWASRPASRRRSEVPAEIRNALSDGWIESKNLVEWLIVDRVRLLNRLLKDLGLELDREVVTHIQSASSESALKQSWAISRGLAERIRPGDATYQTMVLHRSDVVREWSALVVGCCGDLSFPKRLAWLKTQAEDSNAGVREWAWMSLRSHVAEDPVRAVKALVPWTGSRNERLRRFASEVTRPRGVWCAHIELLKQQPELGLPLLEPLRSDDSLYVRNSVANWLNDASKSQPQWVTNVTQRWLEQSTTRETQSLVKRARRTLYQTSRD